MRGKSLDFSSVWEDVVGVDSGLNWLRYRFWKALFVVTEPGSEGELVNEGGRSICAAKVHGGIIRTWDCPFIRALLGDNLNESNHLFM